MIDSICVVVKSPPGDERATLGIRTSYATLMSSMETKMFFMDEGVYNLLENPGYNTATLKEVIREDGEVYCTREGLKTRGLPEDALLQGVRVIPENEVAGIIEACRSVAVF
jgi:sulfur relay (sulfurtransferase) DsrF/TusC family protein